MQLSVSCKVLWHLRRRLNGTHGGAAERWYKYPFHKGIEASFYYAFKVEDSMGLANQQKTEAHTLAQAAGSNGGSGTL